MKASDNYWIFNPQLFDKLYKRISFINFPAFIVSAFLEERSRVLLQMFSGKKGVKLLDVGCGSGVHMLEYAKLCSEVIGVDYSRKMLSIARDNLKNLPEKNWKLIRADAQNLPFEDNQFDVVIAMGLLDYVDSSLKVLSECRRVLKKGGLIVFSIPKKPSIFSFLRTPVGNLIKKLIFKLPPVGNAVNYQALVEILKNTNFEPLEVKALWTAMWMVKAQAS